MKRMLLAFLILSRFSLAPAWAANEQARDNMGANCVCSHTFQTVMTNFGQAASGARWVQESDTTDKRCGEALDETGKPIYAVSVGYGFQTNAARSAHHRQVRPAAQ